MPDPRNVPSCEKDLAQIARRNLSFPLFDGARRKSMGVPESGFSLPFFKMILGSFDMPLRKDRSGLG